MPYSSECVEGEFSEVQLPLYAVLGSLRPRGKLLYSPLETLAKEGVGVRPQNALDWIAFVFLLIGACAWGYFVTDVNILDVVLERIWDPLDDMVFVLIFLSGVWWIYRVFTGRR